MSSGAASRMTLKPEHAGNKLAGQRLGAEEGHEYPGRQARLRISRNAHRTAFAHFLDHAEDAFLGRRRNAVTQLHTLLAQQIIDRFELGRAVEDDRFTLRAVEVVKHFPVTQVAGDADYALAAGQSLLEHIQTLDFTHHPDA